MIQQGLWVAMDGMGFQVMRGLLSLLWQSSILLLAAGLVAFALRKRKASARYQLWAIALLLSPLLPLFGWWASQAGTPQAALPVMPEYAPPVVVMMSPVEPALANQQYLPDLPAQPEKFRLLIYPWALALGAYAAGLVTFLCMVILGLRRLRLWLREAKLVAEPGALEHFQRAARSIGLKRDFILLESRHIHAPVALGILHPAVLLPSGIRKSLSDDDLRALAIHELSHLRRHDPLILMAVSIIRAVLFFHPLIWIAARQISLLAEQSADDAVLDATGEPVHYARMLARMAEGLPRRALSTELAAGIVLSKGAFLQRVESILSARRDRIRRLTRLAFAGMLLGLLLSIGLALALPLGEKEAPAASKDEPASRVANNVITGIVVDEEGMPVHGAQVRQLFETDETKVAVTEPDGSFRLNGGDSIRFYGSLWASMEDGARQGLVEIETATPSKPSPYRIVMKPSHPVEVFVKDVNGEPVIGAGVEIIHDHAPLIYAFTNMDGIAEFKVPADARVSWVIALKSGVGFDYYENYRSLQSPERPMLANRIELVLDGARTVRVEASDTNGRPQRGVSFLPVLVRKPGKISYANLSGSLLAISWTDEKGIAIFDWFPQAIVQGTEILVKGEEYSCPEPPILEIGKSETLLTAKVFRNVKIGGRVYLPDGTPAAGILVQVEGRGNTNQYCREFSRSDIEGRWSTLVYPKQGYILSVLDEDWASKNIVDLIVDKGKSLDELNFHLTKGTLLHGRVTTVKGEAPVADSTVALIVMGDELPPDMKGHGNKYAELVRWAKTDDNGRYYFRVGPGEYELFTEWDNKRRLTVSAEPQIEENFQLPESFNVTTVITVTHDNHPVGGAFLNGKGMHTHLEAACDENGKFNYVRTFPKAMLLLATSPDRSLAGLADFSATEKNVEVKLSPAARIEGRVLDKDSKPIANQRMQCTIQFESIGPTNLTHRSEIYAHTVTGEDGSFAIAGIPLETQCFVFPMMDVDGPDYEKQIQVAKPEVINLGDFKILEFIEEETPPISKAEVTISTLPAGTCRLAGKVVSDKTGEPVEGARLNLHWSDGREFAFTVSGKDGSFDFSGIPEGTYSFQVSDAPGFQPQSYDPNGAGGQFPPFILKKGEERSNIEFRLATGYRITGRILNENGQPLAVAPGMLSVHAWVEEQQPNGPKFLQSAGQANVFGADGSYTIDGLDGRPVSVSAESSILAQPSDYYPSIFYPGVFGLKDAAFLDFDDKDSIEGIDFRMVRHGGLAIEGIVTDSSTGKPISGVAVYAHAKDAPMNFKKTATDKQGFYRLETLGRGEVLVQFDASDHGYVRTCKAITLNDERTPKLDVALEPGVTLTGSFVDEEGNPVAIPRHKAHGFASLEVDIKVIPTIIVSVVMGGFPPNDDSQSKSVSFRISEGDYSSADMLFTSINRFEIHGMKPGKTRINFDPKQPGTQVAKIMFGNTDLLNSTLTTASGKTYSDIQIVLTSAPSAPGTSAAPADPATSIAATTVTQEPAPLP